MALWKTWQWFVGAVQLTSALASEENVNENKGDNDESIPHRLTPSTPSSHTFVDCRCFVQSSNGFLMSFCRRLPSSV